MAGEDLVAAAADELYAADPGEFVDRRGALAERARAAGAAAAAKQIAGLRKPTRSAWVLNQLVRADPGAADRLDELGGQLRAAQRSLDGEGLRELSVRRRELIDALTRQAFAAAGQLAPPAALRGEVTATLGAALADPRTAQRLRAGALDRPVRREGFDAAAAPVLTLVPPARSAAGLRPGPVPRDAPGRARAERAGAERYQREVAAARRELAGADEEVTAAAAAVRAHEQAARSLAQQLDRARQLLADSRLRARQADAAQRRARQALDRLRRRERPG